MIGFRVFFWGGIFDHGGSLVFQSYLRRFGVLDMFFGVQSYLTFGVWKPRGKKGQLRGHREVFQDPKVPALSFLFSYYIVAGGSSRCW